MAYVQNLSLSYAHSSKFHVVTHIVTETEEEEFKEKESSTKIVPLRIKSLVIGCQRRFGIQLNWNALHLN